MSTVKLTTLKILSIPVM